MDTLLLRRTVLQAATVEVAKDSECDGNDNYPRNLSATKDYLIIAEKKPQSS